MPTIPALDFLDQPSAQPLAAVCVVFGGEAFLKRHAIRALREQLLSGPDADFSLTTLGGNVADPRDVFDELRTSALFGGRRLVLIEDADPFVSAHRARLESYVEKPGRAGVLLLDVTTWATNTRLYKLVNESGLQIECKPPQPRSVAGWARTWGKQRHGAKLDAAAAQLLVEIIGPELGLLDQELLKLATTCGDAPVTAERVQELVGGWRAKTAWEMIDAAAGGDTGEALAQLDRLLLAGEQPLALLGAISWSVRRFAHATRLIERAEAAGQRPNLGQALEQVGVKSFGLQKAQEQMRRLGRDRAGKLFRWLLDADRDLKGASELPPRVVLERLLVRLGAKAVAR